MLQRFAPGATWRFSKARLVTSEKPQYNSTACRIAIDLRASRSTPLLQSTLFPSAPSPTTTIAAVLQLKHQQRFDIMAVPAAVLDKRRSGAGNIIADVRLVDGSIDPRAEPEKTFASMPLTLFFDNDKSFGEFEEHVGRTPLLFMCLNGNVSEGTLQVTTLRNMSFWLKATGEKCDEMAALAPFGERVADVTTLPSFTPTESVDYQNQSATLTACSLLDIRAASVGLLEDAATEHVYQLNHVYVPQPAPTHDVTFDNRLFAVFDCWDFSKKVQLAFRSKAILSLAQQEDSDSATYVAALNAQEIKHSLLASLRVRVKKGDSTDDGHINALVVEATPVCWDTDSEIPNDAVDALHGLLATDRTPSSERLVAASLSEIASSPFYNMTVAGEPAEKAFVLLHFTQRSIGAQQTGGFRLVTDNVVDGNDLSPPQGTQQFKVGIVARCSVERCPDFTAAKASYALAVVCKAARPAKPQHALDLYIEAMELLTKEQISPARETLAKLRSVSAAARTDTEPSDKKAFQQRKCRRLLRYPTMGDH